MSLQAFQIVYLIVALLLANLPWLSQRCFFILQCETKTAWLRLLEWAVLFFVFLGLGFLLEQRSMGTTHVQDWEFYAVMLALFAVFALPGFIYRHVR